MATIFEDDAVRVEALSVLSGFRTDFYDALTARGDALFELTDALLCTDGPVKTLVDLALAPEHRRGYGALYDGLNAGAIEVARLRKTMAGLPLPRYQGRIVLAVDVSNWLRPDAPTSGDRLFCHVYGRAKSNAQMIPGWPYSFVVALEPGRTSWTAILDAIRLGPADDATAVTPPKHGAVFNLKDSTSWPEPDHTTTTDTDRYGTATAKSWDRLHPRLTRRTCWLDHDAELPIVEGTIVRLTVDHLPGDRDPKPVWLWWSETGATAEDVDRLWQAFLRRFDIEHTFRMIKGTLGWTRPKLRDPAAADRWTWLVIAVHTQLRLARPLAEDLRRPWERRVAQDRLTPARVRRGFRNIHATIAQPAGAPKPGKPGPGRPPGSKNRRPAQHHDVGKTVKRDLSLTGRQSAAAG